MPSALLYLGLQRIVWIQLKNVARIFQENKLGLAPVHKAAAKFTMLFQEDRRVGT